MPSTIGLIGGSGLLKTKLTALQGLTEEQVATPHGPVFLRTGRLPGGAALVFVQRHDARPSRAYTQPADINYPAIALALKAKRCDFVVAICSVGGLKPSHGVGTLLVCSDFWCPWDLRRVYEDARAHVMPSLCEPLRRVMLDIVRGAGEHPLPTGVYANARGPRFETRTEIRLMADYCDVVGMTAAHEASACCEVGLPYAMLAMVDNFANGVGNETLTVDAFHAAQASNLVRLERCVEALLAALPLRAAEVAPPGGGGGGAGTGAGNGAGAAPHGAPEPVDLLVHARWVVCMAPGREGEVLEAHAVASRGGRIVAVLPSAAATARFLPTRVVTLDARHALMPGLVNAHTHLAMNLMRGLSDDKPLMAWLSEAIWPVEGKLVDAEFVRAGARAAVGELIKGGVTTFNDMYFFPEATASVAEAAGVRALVGLPILEFPTGYASGAEDYVAKGLATAKAWGERAAAGAASSRVTFALAPHAPYTVADATLARLAALSAAALPPLRVHIHLHETEGEVLASKTGGKQGTSKHLSDEQTSPLVNLDRLGLLNERLIAVHMTCLTDEEMARVAASGASVVHCPNSNLKLASGFCPVARLLKGGVNVALGTDGAGSNNSLDVFQEMKLAATLAKGVSGDATAVPAWQALRMATLNGARALGLGAVTGSLEVGKAVDMVAVELDGLNSLPLYDVLSHLVYATGRGAVSDVWVDGVQLLANRALTTIDEEACKVDMHAWEIKVRAVVPK